MNADVTYYSTPSILATGFPPKHKVYCAASRKYLGYEAYVTVKGRTVHYKVLDVCPLHNRIDLPSREFIARFGRAGIKRGKIHAHVRFVK